MPVNTTIDKKGADNIEINIYEEEKLKISLILTIANNGIIIGSCFDI